MYASSILWIRSFEHQLYATLIDRNIIIHLANVTGAFYHSSNETSWTQQLIIKWNGVHSLWIKGQTLQKSKQTTYRWLFLWQLERIPESSLEVIMPTSKCVGFGSHRKWLQPYHNMSTATVTNKTREAYTMIWLTICRWQHLNLMVVQLPMASENWIRPIKFNPEHMKLYNLTGD